MIYDLRLQSYDGAHWVFGPPNSPQQAVIYGSIAGLVALGDEIPTIVIFHLEEAYVEVGGFVWRER